MANNWTRTEHILAFNLYWRLPFGKMHKGNPEIIDMAKTIGRTPSSVAMKLVNFARLDPALQSRGVSGLSHGAKGEIEIWEEFSNSPEDLAYESEKIRAESLNTPIETSTSIETNDLPREGVEREVLIKQRVNQSFFRRRILSAYENTCCVTGLNIPSLLVAGHIVPWSIDKANRLNARNGLCLNMLHDKAFDRGLMWIDEDFTIHYQENFTELSKDSSEAYLWLKQFEGKKLKLPKNFSPSTELLKSHASGSWR